MLKVLALKTDAELRERSRKLASRLGPIVVMLVLATTVASAAVQPQLTSNLQRYPLGMVSH